MSEYIMGLGVSVKICRAYQKLMSMVFNKQENTNEYLECVDEIKTLIEDETETYDRLDVIELDEYFKRISEEDTSNFDEVKSRYYLKLKERIDLLENDSLYEYPFTLNTAIFGKILLESLLNVELQFKDMNKRNNNGSISSLYSFHKTYKYTLISSNDFLERLAVDFNFNLDSIPKISFDKIKDNFDCDNTFYNYLNKTLYLMAIDTINTLIRDNVNIGVSHLYSEVLFISQLKVICSYIDYNAYKKLVEYCKMKNINEHINGKYISSALVKKKVKRG